MTCPQCGKEASGRFCGQCGAATSQAPPLVSDETVSDQPRETFFPASPKPTVMPKTTWVHQGRFQAAAGIVAIIALVTVIIAYGGGAATHTSDTASGSKATTTSAPTVTPHETCTLQVSAMAAHMLDQTSGLSAEMVVNGYSDPFFSPAEDVWRQMIDDKYNKGMAAASENGRTNAGNVCSSTLNDAIRPNYPTDGTYPDTGSSGDSGGGGGSSQLQCPSQGNDFGNLQSDGQGNMVCVYHNH
jgi:hypothetical protein